MSRPNLAQNAFWFSLLYRLYLLSQALAESLEHNTSVTYINLDDNEIGAGVEASWGARRPRVGGVEESQCRLRLEALKQIEKRLKAKRKAAREAGLG